MGLKVYGFRVKDLGFRAFRGLGVAALIRELRESGKLGILIQRDRTSPF